MTPSTTKESIMQTCFQTTIAGFEISLLQTGPDTFDVIYGKQRIGNLDYVSAAKELGLTIMHASACEGKLTSDFEE
jgi:hypothetical protein